VTRHLGGVALVALCGCVGSRAADRADAAFQDPRATLCSGGDGAAADTPSFALIQSVFSQNCVTCHSSAADLDLSSGHAWQDLVGRPAPAAESCGGILVVPGAPDMSYLYQKLTQARPCSGLEMPRNEFQSDPLPDCLVAMVKDWIASGAPGTPDGGGD
jgi:hypothetical protein